MCARLANIVFSIVFSVRCCSRYSNQIGQCKFQHRPFSVFIARSNICVGLQPKWKQTILVTCKISDGAVLKPFRQLGIVLWCGLLASSWPSPFIMEIKCVHWLCVINYVWNNIDFPFAPLSITVLNIVALAVLPSANEKYLHEKWWIFRNKRSLLLNSITGRQRRQSSEKRIRVKLHAFLGHRSLGRFSTNCFNKPI